jgi:hypothetical protein
MEASRLKYAFITKTRPTQFLTRTGELSDFFDDALLLGPGEIEGERANLDEPEDFEVVEVLITVEV